MAELLGLELDRLERAYSEQRFHRLPTGVLGWDLITGGLARGAVHLLSCPQQCGLTSLALTVASNLAVQRDESVLFITRLPADEVARRTWAAQSLVPIEAIRSGQLGPDDWTALTRAAANLTRGPLRVAAWTVTPADPIAVIETQIDENQPSLIVLDNIDYHDIEHLRQLARHHDLAVLLARPGALPATARLDLITTATAISPDLPRQTTTGFAAGAVHTNRAGPMGEFPLAFLEEYLTWVDVHDIDTPRFGPGQAHPRDPGATGRPDACASTP